MITYDIDEMDGALFRFWVWAASRYPGETARAIASANNPADYREALINLSVTLRVNLPHSTVAPRLVSAMEIVGPKPKPLGGLGIDMTDEYKARAYDRLRQMLYPVSEKADG